MRRYFHLVLFLTLATLSRAQVRVWEGTLALPTYEEGMPDPNPPFDQFTNNKFNYPYVLRENLTSRRENHDWRAIYLENEYLKCSVLPDIGGHLYTCVDKISGQSMFYANTSIKKAAVGYRGAWAAFGIEFNFPVSHNWVSMSPVDFAFHKNADGSASVIVGNVDRVYGMEWTVELILRPKSTLLEERVSLSNRSDVRHRFYWWNNAAARISDDSQIVYPMRFAASHGFTEVVRWPVDEDGHDLSVIRNHVHGAVSLFTHGSREGFMGIWQPASKTGTVHFAQYEELPAKKIWSWGVDEEGLDWRKALSDDNSGYVEIQAGLFRNQETYAFMAPRQSIHFSEYWMPVREIGGISRANLSGVLSLARHGNALAVGFNANRIVPKATVSILSGSSSLFSEKVDFSPERAWTHELPVNDSPTKYTVEIRDALGAVLIRHTEGEYDWTPESEIHVGPQPSFLMPDSERRTCDDWIQLGKELELNGKNLQALDVYEETLRRFPDSFSALKSAGRLTAGLLRFEEAKSFLEHVHARDTSDPEISYYLGIAYDGLGETREARTSYEDAQRFASFRAAAALRLGEMLARDGDLNDAERHLSEAVRAEPDDVRATEELVAVKITSGKTEEGKTLARQAIARFPLSYLLGEELGEPNLKQLANDAIRVLNLAAEYMRLGQSAASDYKIASKLPTSYVFPSSVEELTVLNAVVLANPRDATAQYLLGTLHFSRGLTDSALAEWSLSRKSNPQIPVLDASLGLALLHEKHDAEQSLVTFRDGLQSDANNVTVYLGADQALSLLSKPANERVQVLEKYPQLADAPSSLIFELILNLAEAGDFQRAESLFHNRFFPREEGGTNVRQVWVEVELQKMFASARDGHCADALVAAEHLGTPVPDLPFTHDGLEPILQSARTNYLLGAAYSRCAKPEEAAKKFQLASAASAPDQMVWAWRAAQKLPGFDGKQWQGRLQTALTQAESRADTSGYTSWWDYTAGVLAGALGSHQEADQKLQQALLLPDRMLSYHFTRMARAEDAP